MRFFPFSILLAISFSASLAYGDNEAVKVEFMLDELEYRWQDGDDPLAWSAALYAGTESRGFWLISEGDHTFGELGGNEMRAYYSHGLDIGWNVNVGWRGDAKPEPGRDWVLLGFEGQAPGAVGMALTVYGADSGDSAFRLEADRSFELASNWVLTPEMKANFYGQNTPETGNGAGLSVLEIAVRLAYEWSPAFTTYVGAIWESTYGRTADWVEAEGDDRSVTQMMVGVSLAF